MVGVRPIVFLSVGLVAFLVAFLVVFLVDCCCVVVVVERVGRG